VRGTSDIGRAADRDPELGALVELVAARHSAPPASGAAPTASADAPGDLAAPPKLQETGGGWIVPISIASMLSSTCFVAKVPVANIAAFLNDLGQAAADARLRDVQFWMQQRRHRRQQDVELWGMVLDVDEVAQDPFATLSEAGLPAPNSWWRTRHGYKAVWAFNRAAELPTFEGIAQQYTLSVQGGDPQSWSPFQPQHLPIVKKTTDDGIIDVCFPATQPNASPLSVDEIEPELPPRLARALADERRLTDSERDDVEEWLADLGIPAPEGNGQRALYQSCPASDQHTKACCYVSRRDTGAIDVTCLGGHGGDGHKYWSESDLYALVSGNDRSASRLDAVRDIPPTWAGFEYLRTRVEPLFAQEERQAAASLTAAAISVWVRAKAAADLRRALKRAATLGGEISETLEIADVVQLFEQRRRGFESMTPHRLYFDDVAKDLRLLLESGERLRLKIHGDSLHMRTHRHEWMASCAYGVTVTSTKNKKTGEISVAIKNGFDRAFESEWNKALVGHSEHLAKLGVPRLTAHTLAAAFLEDSCRIAPETRCIHIVRSARLLPADTAFDPLAYFRQLYREGRLPLASEDDVPRFVMAIASPLLRFIAPGQLGIYWFIGPSGTGKDFNADLVADIHGKSVPGENVPTRFDLSLTDDLEQKRSFAKAEGTLYARAKEAGKRRQMIDFLIEVSCTDSRPARVMHGDEYQVRNTFTYLADSVETLPNRREVSRRTVMINVAAVDEDTSFGRLRDDVLKQAPNIIASLKRLIETKAPEWYLFQDKTDSRPLIPVALARLLGATLPAVSGANTDELFEAVLYFVANYPEEGEAQRKLTTKNDSQETRRLPSYRLSYFIDTMKRLPGYEQLFRQFATVKSVELFLDREARYADVKLGRRRYLRLEVSDKVYAFKLVRDARNFVFAEEKVFCAALNIEPENGSGEPPAKSSRSPEQDTASGPARFSSIVLPTPHQSGEEPDRAPKPQ
jgi:hypothetical protein